MSDTLAFLRAVLPDVGRYCTAVKLHSKSGFRHTFRASIELLLADQTSKDAPGCDVYVALAAFDDSDKRTAAAAHTLRALWIDVDCGAGKPYPDFDAGMSAVDDFIERGFPNYSFVVRSGYGAHVYWAFGQDAPREQWLVLAKTFQAAWQAAGIATDPISADAARVLRCPGTHNRKNEPAVQVVIDEATGLVHRAETLFAAARKLAPETLPIRPSAAAKVLALNDDLLANLPQRKAYLPPIVAKCKQLGDMAKTQGAGCSEPLWYATIGLCRHLEDGAVAAHHLSGGHSEYSAAAVNAKLAQLADKDVGPTTCERFKVLNAAGCAGCPWSITSPIQLGEKDPEPQKPVAIVAEQVLSGSGEVEVVEREISAPVAYPLGYAYEDNATKARVVQDNGIPTWKLIFPGMIFPTRVFRPPGGSLEIEIFTRRHTTGEVRTFNAPAVAVGDPREMRNQLLSNVMVDAGVAPMLQKLINGMASAIQDKETTDMSVRQFGWQMGDPATEKHFVFGATRYTPEGTDTNCMLDAGAQQMADALCKRTGTPEGALQGARLFDRPGAQMHQAVYLTGLAGVFAPFTGAQNFAVLSLVERNGGQGKTTNCDAAMSHWFSPLHSRSSMRDTQNALYNTMSVRGTLPVHVDELTGTLPEVVVNFVYTASQGAEKARMESSGAKQRAPLPPWKAPVLVTCNSPLKEMVRLARGDAGALDARIVELRYVKLDLDPAGTETIRNCWYKNYGWTGPAVAAHVAKHHDHYAAAAVKLRALLENQLGPDSADRFWVNWALGVLLAALAFRDLSWVDYGIRALMDWLVSALALQRATKVAARRVAADLLAEFLGANAGRIAVAERVKTGEVTTAVLSRDTRVGPVVGRSQLDERVLYVSRWAIQDFLSPRNGPNFDYGAFIAECAEVGLLAKAYVVGGTEKEPIWSNDVPSKCSLGRGTVAATAPIKCVAFSLAHEALREHRKDAIAHLRTDPGYQLLKSAQ